MEIEDLISGRISNKKGKDIVFSILGDGMMVSKLSDLIDDFGEEEGFSVRSSFTAGHDFIILGINDCSDCPDKRTATYKKYIMPLLKDRELDTLEGVISTLEYKKREYKGDLAAEIIEDLISILKPF